MKRVETRQRRGRARWLGMALALLPLVAGAQIAQPTPNPASVPTAEPAPAAAPGPAAPPSDERCPALSVDPQAPRVRSGERLEYKLDALGAEAGKLVLRVLAPRDGLIPVEGRAESNAFFSKIRRVEAKATTFLDPQSFAARRYEEDSLEDDVHRTADVAFVPETHRVEVRYTIGERPGEASWRYANQAVDVLSALYALRRISFQAGAPLCLDAYGIRHPWRVFGKVVGREHLSLGMKEFDAWHVAGEAVRLDDPEQRRQVEVWISDDALRLPLVAVGTVDVGAVRAVLTAYGEPGTVKIIRAEPKSHIKW